MGSWNPNPLRSRTRLVAVCARPWSWLQHVPLLSPYEPWRVVASPPSSTCRALGAMPMVSIQSLPVGLLECPTCVSVLLFASLSSCCRCLYLFAGCRSPSQRAVGKRKHLKQGAGQPRASLVCWSCLCPLSCSSGCCWWPWHGGEHDFGGGEQPG